MSCRSIVTYVGSTSEIKSYFKKKKKPITELRNQVFQFSKMLLPRMFKLTPVVVEISDVIITFDVISFEVLLI